MSTADLAGAIAQAQQSVARHESQNAGDPFHFDLTEHRYVALRDLLAALSSPPADDVRELVDHLNGLMDSLDDSVTHEQIYEQLQVAWNMARALRPRGTVTDDKPVAWAIYGLESHRFLRVQEAVSDNDRRFYNVRPLFAGEVES